MLEPEVCTRIDPAGKMLVVDAGAGFVVVLVVVVVVAEALVVLPVDVLALIKGGALAPLGATPPGKGFGTVGGKGLFVTESDVEPDVAWGRKVAVGLTGRAGTGATGRTVIGCTGCATGPVITGARKVTGGRPGTCETAAKTKVPIKARAPNRLTMTRMIHHSRRTCVLS